MANRTKGLGKTKYFFYNGDLHRRVKIDRGSDTMVAYNYADKRPHRYIYSDVLRNAKKAWTTREVTTMLHRERKVAQWAITNGNIRRPPMVLYNRTTGAIEGEYRWSEEHIMELHAYLATVHIGRPRADGGIDTRDLPGWRELRATIRQEPVFYIERNGEMIPTWEAPF